MSMVGIENHGHPRLTRGQLGDWQMTDSVVIASTATEEVLRAV